MKSVTKYAVPAAITLVTVLVGIYALRKVPGVNKIGAPLVNKALNG